MNRVIKNNGNCVTAQKNLAVHVFTPPTFKKFMAKANFFNAKKTLVERFTPKDFNVVAIELWFFNHNYSTTLHIRNNQ